MQLPIVQLGPKPAPADPAKIGFPPTLPIEIVLRTASVRELCAEYHISRDQWNELRADPHFKKAVASADETMRQEGMSFRMKARLQAEQLLQTSWDLIHNTDGMVPAAVKADLTKFIIRVAGLDAGADKGSSGQNNALQININLG
jgi:hypothetical protein